MKFVFPHAPGHESAKKSGLLGEEGVELHLTFEDSFSNLETCVVLPPADSRPIYEQIKHLLEQRRKTAALPDIQRIQRVP